MAAPSTPYEGISDRLRNISSTSTNKLMSIEIRGCPMPLITVVKRDNKPKKPMPMVSTPSAVEPAEYWSEKRKLNTCPEKRTIKKVEGTSTNMEYFTDFMICRVIWDLSLCTDMLEIAGNRAPYMPAMMKNGTFEMVDTAE
jgi:hypothetical protein